MIILDYLQYNGHGEVERRVGRALQSLCRQIVEASTVNYIKKPVMHVLNIINHYHGPKFTNDIDPIYIPLSWLIQTLVFQINQTNYRQTDKLGGILLT